MSGRRRQDEDVDEQEIDPGELDELGELADVDPDASPAEVLAGQDDDEPLEDDEIIPDDEAGRDADTVAAAAAGEHAGDQSSSPAGEVAGDAGAADDDQALDASDAPPLKTILESVLFAAAEPVPLTRLVKLLGAWPRATVSTALDELRQTLIEDGRGIRVMETGGGVQLRSAAECAPWVRRFFAEKPPRLSRAVLETLAIVAYRQPATRGEVEAVRGVNCDAVLGALLARQLIQVVGRRQSPGRPVEYGTTAAFLELFSLRDLDELPELPEPAALARLIEEAEATAEQAEGADADPNGETAEDLEPGGDRLAPGGGGPDPGGPGPGERQGGPGAGDEGGPEQGPHHR